MALRRRTLTRFLFALVLAIVLRLLLFPSRNSSKNNTPTPHPDRPRSHQIKHRSLIERAVRPDQFLDVQRHSFLQARMGRDERREIMADTIADGMWDWWERIQIPYIINKETSAADAQHVAASIDQLLSLNGWVAALCPTLTRPFSNSRSSSASVESYTDLVTQGHLYYVALIIHSADHFLLDQLAVIVQIAKRFGTQNIFVSTLDYASSDATETLTDLTEAVLTLLGVPFRIRRVPALTHDPKAAYYPAEEAYMRNLVLEPLGELERRRGIRFKRVVWLKGFTCPNDILETIKISLENEAAMVCGMDWAESSGLFYFSDRWRTRDIEGDQFRQASSKGDSPPLRDKRGAARYAQHLPFQVFCCESGMHVVDPAQSYYAGLIYRAGTDFQNVSRVEGAHVRGPEAPCLDSSQAWFCRDLWVWSASLDDPPGVSAGVTGPDGKKKREVVEVAAGDAWMEGKDGKVVEVRAKADMEVEERQGKAQAAAVAADADANAGSDYDAMPKEQGGEEVPTALEPAYAAVPNSAFRPARILVNPRCVTTYAGVSHTQLAQDLFGDPDGGMSHAKKYVLDEWEGAPDSFVCQEQTQTGGREAVKTQRRVGFSIHERLLLEHVL